MKQYQVTIYSAGIDDETTKVVDVRGLLYHIARNMQIGDAITINRIDDTEDGEL